MGGAPDSNTILGVCNDAVSTLLNLRLIEPVPGAPTAYVLTDDGREKLGIMISRLGD